jgi:hypothetical protein
VLGRILVAFFGAVLLLFTAVGASEGDIGPAAIVALVAVAMLYFAFRRGKPAAAPVPAPLEPASLSTPIVIALVVIVMDVAVLGVPLLAASAAFFSATAGLFWALAAFRERGVLLSRLRAVAIVLGISGVLTALGMYDGRLARERVTAVAESLKAYKAKHGGYPESLDALVPEYFPRVPSALTLGVGSRIRYFRGKDGSAELMYVSIPPFGRSRLRVDTGRWDFFD